jgi:hypothetical protein
MFGEWLVPDVPADMEAVKLVFVLESPHKKELEKKCPAAGTAGKAMARFLTGSGAKALGELIRDGETGNRYGIVNVCRIPMQKSAYNSPLSAEQNEIVKQLEKLRNPDLKSVDDELYSALLEDFKTRLSGISGKTRIIPCGRFARKALPAGMSWTADEIPHPSFGNWRKARYQKALAQIGTATIF